MNVFTSPFLASLCVLIPGVGNAISEPPNILFVLTEDQGAHLSLLETPALTTPHMDSLAQSGTYFSNAFVAYPVCSASKAAFYTGLHNHTPVSNEYGECWAYISSGTWSLVGVETSAPILTDEAMKMNVMGLWLVQRLKVAFDNASDEMTYGELTQRVNDARPFTGFVGPDHSSFLDPLNMLDAVINFCRLTGQSAPTDACQAVRCVLESFA